MGLIKNALVRLETRLQILIEGNAARIFASGDNRNDLAVRLIAAMESGAKIQNSGETVAPNLYILTVHPSQAEDFEQDIELLDALAQALQDSAGETGLVFLSPPVLRIVADEDLPPRQVMVKAQVSIDHLDKTSDMVVEDAANSAQPAPSSAFLIVNGTRIYALTQSVINIGRRPDNHLVIDDGRISRVHAQLRAIKGRYVIFDLDSLGGTLVNDQRVHQCVLYPGDVISLSGVPLVFGQDEAKLGETQKLSPE